MSATATEPAPKATAPTAPASPEQPAPEAPAQETDWKAEARKWEQRAKENKGAADKLAQIEEANKTDLEKAQDRAAKAEARALEADRKAFAAEKGVPVSLVTGTTPEQWEAAVTEALAWRGDAPKPPVTPPADWQGKVGEPVNQGLTQVTNAELQTMTPEQINQARREGRLDVLLGKR